LWKSADDTARAKVREVEIELRAQVKRNFDLGLRPSHLDTHMGVVYRRPELLKVYVKVAVDYDLKPMLVRPSSKIARRVVVEKKVIVPERLILEAEKLGVPLLDELYTEIPGRSYQEKVKGFRFILADLRPRTVNQVIVHLGLNTEELGAIIRGERYIERYLDYKLVTFSKGM